MNHQRFIGCLLVLLVWSSCQTEQKEKTIDLATLDLNTIDWQAHRGGKGLAPENTVPAFTYAVTLPYVKTLELDLVVSKDSVLVVSHEPWMSSKICLTPEGSEIGEANEKQLNIFQMTLEEITAYDCGSKPVEDFPEQKKIKTSKPTFENIVKAVNAYAAQKSLEAPQFNIEIKSAPEGDNIYHPEPATFATLVINAINRLRIKERSNIQSFDVRALQAVHQQDSTLQLAYLISTSEGLEQDLQKLGFTPNIISPNHQLVNADFVKAAHARGMKVIPWTVNDVERMKALLVLGVDGIITDYPNLIPTLK